MFRIPCSIKKNGFTLMELLIVAVVIIILTAAVLANYKSGYRQLVLQRAVYKLGQDIRRVQSMAGLEEAGCKKFGGDFHVNYQYGYGISLSKNPPAEKKKYILFADCDGSLKYNLGNDEIIETIEFEKGVETKNLSPGRNNLDIVFVPPDPSVYINEEGIGVPPNLAIITICLEKDTLKTKTVAVNKAGLIDID